MKVSLNRLFLKSALAVGLAAVPALAQNAGTPPTPPDPATVVQHRVDRLATFLTLTAAQKTQAVSIFTASETAGRLVRDQLHTQQTALQAAIKANSGIEGPSALIGTLTGQLTSIEAKANAQFYALLTAEQKTRFDAMRGPGFGGGPGGPGGPRGFGGPGRMGRGEGRPPADQ